FLYGTYGLTTDYAHWASDWAAAIHPEEETYELTTDEAIELNATIDTYIRDTKEITPDIVVIDGKEHIQVDGNKITAKSAGTAHVLLRHTHDSREADRYDIYTEPIEITVEQGKIDVTALEERIEEAKTYTNEDGK